MLHAPKLRRCLTPATIPLPVSGGRALACEIRVAVIVRTIVHRVQSSPDAD